MFNSRIIPVITIENADAACFLADALLEGGLPLAEITFRTPAAAEVIARMVKHSPEMCVGAGTILTAENMRAAIQAGAKFGVAPGTNPEMVKLAEKSGFPFIPGVCTPSEVEAALSLGCKILKFFPAEAAGGLAMLGAIYAPYASTGVKFLPTGGVSPENLAHYLRHPAVLACGGTWLATKTEIAEGQWARITEKCRLAGEIVRGL